MNAYKTLFALFATSAVTLAGAQTGSDACATADPIAGQGSFAFDTSTATISYFGQFEFLCYQYGVGVIDDDVWFSWVADSTGIATVSTCTADIDTRVAAYETNTCPVMGTAIACSDDECGLQSAASFPCTSGTTYMLQVGSFPNSGGGTGNIDIAITPNTPPNDDCSNPTVIAGRGSFPFDLVGATTGVEGQNEANCQMNIGLSIKYDVWYSWTSDFTGTAVIGTCNTSMTGDTKLAVYPGTGCPTTGTSIVCDDDGCGLQARVQLSVTAGTSYMIQLGTPIAWGAPNGVVGQRGMLDISDLGNVTGDSCNNPIPISGDGRFEFNNWVATAGTEGQNEALCPSAGIDKDLWFEWTSNATGFVNINTCPGSLTSNTKLVAYPAGGCPTDGSALACSEDSCGAGADLSFFATGGLTYLIQVGDSLSSPGIGWGVMEISFSNPEPGIGTCFCDSGIGACGNPGAFGNGCANGSDPNGANLVGGGSATLGQDTLVLMASGLAPSQPGLYFQGNVLIGGGTGATFGDGLRCAGQNVIRLGVAMASASGTSNTGNFAQPISVKGGVSAGELRHYQLWYRDPAGTLCGSSFNLTNAYSIQW